MTSLLPSAVVDSLTRVARALDDRLQADSYKVGTAIAVDEAFDHGYVDSALQRALLCSIVPDIAGFAFSVELLGNAGCELRRIDEGIERRFRFKSGRRDAWGDLIVRTNSDSFITQTVRDMYVGNLFNQGDEDCGSTEQWVLAYRVHPGTRTLAEISARLPVDLRGKSPYRLVWGPIVPLPLGGPTPPAFPGKEDDLPMEDEEGGKETGSPDGT